MIMHLFSNIALKELFLFHKTTAVESSASFWGWHLHTNVCFIVTQTRWNIFSLC
jgi:hypothetical protein